MTALLVGVTFVALGLAGALLFYVLRLSRENRERREARAAALAEMIGGAPAPPARASSGHPERSTEAPPLFGEVVQAERRSGSPLLLAAGAGVVLLAIAGIYAVNRAGGASAATQAPAPLELMSLRHERSGESLLISGTVHNPQAGRRYDDLVAVVFTFDRQGSYLTSGRAGLDFRQLPPGEESPFSIALPSAAGVARYRVSFRTEATVIPHLDRRNQPAHVREAAQ